MFTKPIPPNPDNNGLRPPPYNPEYLRATTGQQEVPLVAAGRAQPSSIHGDNPCENWNNGNVKVLPTEESSSVFAECVPVTDTTEEATTNNPRYHAPTTETPFQSPPHPAHNNYISNAVMYDGRHEHPSFIGNNVGSSRDDDDATCSSTSSNDSHKSFSLHKHKRAARHHEYPLVHGTTSAARSVLGQVHHAARDVRHQARHTLKQPHHMLSSLLPHPPHDPPH